MNPSSDDARIRQLIQRVQQADEHQVPAFADVLQHRRRIADSSRRQRWAAGIAAVAALVVVMLLFWPRAKNDGVVESRPSATQPIAPTATATESHEQVVAIDFGDLHSAVEEHFSSAETATGVPVWASRTESLLVVRFDVSLAEE